MVDCGVLRRGAHRSSRNVRRRVVALLALSSLLVSLGTVATYLAEDAPDYGAIHAAASVAVSGGDPYDNAAVSRVEVRDEGTAGAGVLPYFYPPSMTALQLPLGILPYKMALRAWGVLIAVAALVAVILVISAVWRTSTTPVAVLTACAVGLAFAPLRRGLELGQVDPFIALPATLGVLQAVRGHDRRAGLGLSALLLKPQLAALPLTAMAAGRRTRLLVGVCAGVLAQAVVVLALNLAGYRLDPIAWLHSLRGGDPHRPLVVAAEVVSLAIALTIVAVVRPWRSVGGSGERFLVLLSLGAIATAIVGPLAKLNPQSDVLLLVPGAVVAAATVREAVDAPLSMRRSLALGCVGGALLGDTLFAVEHYNGAIDATMALLTVALALAAVAIALPSLAMACAFAAVVNAALTLPPFPPGYDGVVSALAATGLCALLCAELARRTAPRSRQSTADDRASARPCWSL